MAWTTTNPTGTTTAAGDEATAVGHLREAVTTTGTLKTTYILTITGTWTTADTRTADRDCARHVHPLTTRRRRVDQCRRSRQAHVGIQAMRVEATGAGTNVADRDACPSQTLRPPAGGL